MTRVSQYLLDTDIEKRMFGLFWRSLTRLGSSEETAEFFSDLLGKNEQMMLAKRYTIAVLLSKGKNYQQIALTLHVSPATINTVSAWLKNLQPATKKIINRHLKDEAWGQFFDKIEEIFDILTPGKYQNWQKEGKAKYRRSLARLSREELR